MEQVLAVVIPFVIIMLTGQPAIKFLKKLNFGQQIRAEGPESHQTKAGIPTMGGLIILFGVIISVLFLLNLNQNILLLLIITLGMGLIGFLDDFLKIRLQRSMGLSAKEKLSGQLLLGILLATVTLVKYNSYQILIPFQGVININPVLFFLMIVFTVVGTANAVNLTDGLDGLAGGVTAITAGSFALLTALLGFIELSDFSLILAGSCLGFVWYNSHPAQVFMGDVGSLALGGALATISVISGTEVFLFLIGGVFVIETISVMIQVSYFRLTGGKRVFRMTPIHHHYELKGMQESKVVARFLLISLIFSAIGLAGFYLI